MYSKGPFKVGDWRVEPDLDRISQASNTRNLRPKVMELLVYLSQRPGKVISAEEILDDLWAGKIVTDSSVYRCVGELREALAGNEGQHTYIQTIPKKGYCLIAPVTDAGENQEPARDWRKTVWLPAIASTLLLVVAIALWAPVRSPSERVGAGMDRKSIAVLPFENVGGDSGHVYVADGIHNDLLTQLAKIDGLKVISRMSVLEYRDSRKNVREIGQELAVAAVLEGSVQLAGDDLRVNVQLIDSETDTHLWANAYDRHFTVDNVLSIQREITTAIAEALQTTLSPAVAARINEIPTTSTAAYELYLSGNEYFASADQRNFLPFAVKQYEKAVATDPAFVEAWAALARAHTAMYGDRFLDRTASRMDKARDALDHAFDLSADSSEVFFASGVYHQMLGAYERALADFDRAEQGLPGDARIFWRRAESLERAGRWDESVAEWRRAIKFDPRNVGILRGQAWTHIFLRDYAEAERSFDRILELRPDLSEAYFTSAGIIPFLRDGDSGAVVAALKHPLTDTLDPELRHYFGWIAALYERDFVTALKYIQDWDVGDDGRLFQYLHKESFLGVTYRLAGQRGLAESNFRRVLELIDIDITEIERNPPEAIPEKHAILLTSRGEALAALGYGREARSLALQSIEMMPASKDAVWSSIIRSGAIHKVLVAIPDNDAAIGQMELYFAMPGRNSIERTVADPRIDPIRRDPRFVALVEKYKRR